MRAIKPIRLLAVTPSCCALIAHGDTAETARQGAAWHFDLRLWPSSSLYKVLGHCHCARTPAYGQRCSHLDSRSDVAGNVGRQRRCRRVVEGGGRWQIDAELRIDAVSQLHGACSTQCQKHIGIMAKTSRGSAVLHMQHVSEAHARHRTTQDRGPAVQM